MKTRIICLLLSLAFVVGAFGVNGTYAWFVTYSGGAGKGVIHNFKSGNIGYTLVGGFVASKTESDAPIAIQPEENLLTVLDTVPDNLAPGTNMYLVPMELEPNLEEGENKTQKYVDAQIRVKVFYTNIDDAGNISHENSIVGQADGNTPFIAQLATDLDGNTYWRYDEQTNYFYYVNPADSSEVIKGGFDAVDPIPLFSAMYYSGENSNLPTSVFKNSNSFTVKIVFQAKQANYAEWSDIGEIKYDLQSQEEPLQEQ